MYIVYSINPTTLNITARTGHEQYSDAVKSMQEQARDYITIYKAHSKTVFINKDSDMQKYKDATYFLKLEDEGKKIVILEKSEIVQRGYIYNVTKYEAVPILIFSILDVGQSNQKDTTIFATSDFINKLPTKLNNVKPFAINPNYMDELKLKLNKRRPKSD